MSTTHNSHSASTTDTDADDPAHRAEYVAFLHRNPFALDAWQLGFATGIREDTSVQNDRFVGTEVPVWMLDNNFRDPNIDRFCNAVEYHDPEVAVVADVADVTAARDAVALARDLADEFDLLPIVTPKSRDALNALPNDIVAGYPNGYSTTVATDYSRPSDWHGRDVHILGGSPPRTWSAIRSLTTATDDQSSLTDYGIGCDETANIIGIDWNGLHGVAYHGERWTKSQPHYVRADEMSIRETVRSGLHKVRSYWCDRGVWPSTTPREATGDTAHDVTVDDASDLPCPTCGQRPTDPVVVEYECGVRAFCSTPCRDHYEYTMAPTPVSAVETYCGI